jgi:hypothetical protein
MATQIFFNGLLIARPGSYSEIDASALETPSLGASGVVALLGESEGGIPWNQISNPNNELQRARSTGVAQGLFKDGDLREMPSQIFNPSNDADIPSGAQEIIFVKTNPSAAAELTFVDDLSANSTKFTAKDYGQFTNQIQVLIEDATAGAPAKKITFTLDETIEVFDELGATGKFTLQYGADVSRAALIATRATAAVLASSFEVLFENDSLGQDDLVTTQAVGGASLEVVSSDAADTTQVVTVFGLNGTGIPQTQSVTLNGLSAVAVPGTWNLETAVVLDTAAAGIVTVQNAAGAVVVFDIPIATLSEGRVVVDIPIDDLPATPTLTIESDGASVQQVVFRGVAQNTQAIAEVVTVTGTTPFALTGSFARITSYEVADVEVAQTLTLKGRMVNSLFVNEVNLQKLITRVNAEPDFAMVSLIGAPKSFLLANLDPAAAADCHTPATLGFFAREYDLVTTINAASQLVTAENVSTTNQLPANAATTFLAGGHEGDPLNPSVPTTLQADWIGAVDLLKQVLANTLVPATEDASIHAIVDAHCAYMGGVGRKERDAKVGAGSLETKTAIKQRALDLNSRHMALWPQDVELFNIAGERVTQPPKFGAALLAGMQAGSPVGTPLTNKQINVLNLEQHSTWNPVDDVEELIQAGVCFAELVDGEGFKVVRGVTTHLSDDNIAFVEQSVNEATNFSAFNFRTAMEAAVGKKGFAGTVNAAYAVANGILDELLNIAKSITGYRNLKITLVADTLVVEVEIASIIGINFVKNKIHLFNTPITAAAA